jgi:hypothetical protein
MTRLVLAAATVVALSSAAATADARPLLGGALAAAAAGAAAAASTPSGSSCQSEMCPRNGTQLTGIARPTLEAKRPVVNAVTLPSGETVDLR